LNIILENFTILLLASADCLFSFPTMANFTTTVDSWSSHYKNHHTSDDLNLKMSSILEICQHGVSNDVCSKNMKDNPGLAFLAVNGFNDLYLLHQVHVLGPSIVFPEEKILALSGSGPVAECFKILKDSLFNDHEIGVPRWNALKGAETKEDVQNLTETATNPSKLRCKNILFIPPLVVNTIWESNTTDPAALIPLLSAEFQQFDKSSDDVKACTILRPVLEFLWAVSKNKINPIILSPDLSRESEQWKSTLHLSYITKPTNLQIQQLPEGSITTTSNDILESLAGALQKINNSSDQPYLNSATSDDKHSSPGGWDKIPEIIQLMILKLSSTNDSAFAPGPTESYTQVLKQNKALGAAMILNVLLSTMGCQVEITTSMANTIKTGNFRANSLQIAHPFSIFNVPYIDAAHMSCFNQTELDLLQSEGEGIPKEIVKKLSENKFKAPKNTHLLRHQFNNWYGILQICFGPLSLLSLEAKEWISHIDKHEASYDTCFKSDSDFGAKILGLVDLTFYQFCDSCLKAKTPDDLDYSIISLHSKRFDIIQNCFQANKPAYLVVPKPSQLDSDDEDKESESKKKKP
jgi:hypothetical protein